MSFVARKVLTTEDKLAVALLAAELGEPCAIEKLRPETLHEFFSSLAELHVSIPYATMRLLGRLASDGRSEVRAAAARFPKTPAPKHSSADACSDARETAFFCCFAALLSIS